MKEFVMKVYYKIRDRILDYRYKVNKNAGICFAYYLIMSIIPICTLCTFLANVFNVDLSLLQKGLESFLTPEFSNIIVGALASREISWQTVAAICISIFVVSKGINQLYGISKELFPAEHARHFLLEQISNMMKTVMVFILLVMIIAILTFFPMIISALDISKNNMIYSDIILFCFFFTILFLLYKIIPDCKVVFVDVAKGAATASFLLVILIALLSLYFRIADYNNVYGPLASIVILLISFSLIAEVIYIGMYVMFEAHMKRLIIDMQRKYDLDVKVK